MTDQDRPATKSKRFLKLAGMTASVAGGYARTRVKGLFLSKETAKAEFERHLQSTGIRLTKTLGELKGAVMKVGQMASLAADILPPEIANALARLQKQAPPMAFEVIAEQIKTEFGKSHDVLFERFDREPYASASIGQVHRARTHSGREVVCKIQYPGVDAAVDSDLRHLKVMFRASGLARINRKAMNSTFEELRERLHEELDYCNEADNLRLFAKYHKKHPFVIIPKVVGERSSKRVLTLTYETGDSIEELDRLNYSPDERDRLGKSLWTLMAGQIFELSAIHADPNPANFAFHRDGRVVIYDFGCIKELPPEIIDDYRDLIVASVYEKYDAVENAVQRLGIRNLDGPPVEHSYYKIWRDCIALPCLESRNFDFGKATMHQEVVKLIPGTLKVLPSFQPAKDLIFLNRTVAGHYANLLRLKTRLPVVSLLEEYVPGLRNLDNPV
jgi:predicted unusual protein kinase regulating ubiquinone biosynthesis (AarF/ABC1/UbiB family)